MAGNKTANILLESELPLIYKAPALLDPAPASSMRPEFIRTRVNSLTVFQKEAFVSSKRASQTWRMSSDEGKYLLGHDAAPAPLAYLTVGMVASFMNELLGLAQLRNIKLGEVRLIQDNFYSMKGSMRDGSMIAGAEGVDIECQFDGAHDESLMRDLVSDAVTASPMGGLMRKTKESYFSLNHNGQKINAGSEATITYDENLYEHDQSFSVGPAEGDWASILQRGGLTPKNVNTNSSAGSSLTDHQDRLLHLRGICTLREDGVKVIEQQLFNPHGSIYTFLSDEAPVDGGKGLAPNAAAYICAGIGFCFMTQFGRFAKMQESKLKGYRIVQDAHFSSGGGSGKTGEAGDVDPLETHVFLISDEDDDFARKILAVSEQTCFLHAFCKAVIKPKIRVTRL